MQQVIEQLSQYRQMQARMQVLSTYSVGAGITVSRLNEDDQLQDLHRKLRGLPSYLYLNKHEHKLETIANAYLVKYPAGIKAQLAAVPSRGADEEDTKLLRELRGKIRKVIASRGYDVRDDIDVVLERLAEFQDLKAELNRIDAVLEALERYRPDYANVLRLRYVGGKSVAMAAASIGITERTFRRWMSKAEEEFSKLSG